MVIQHRLMALPSVIKGRAASERNAHHASDATDPAIEIVIPGRIGGKAYGHEVFQLRDSIWKRESRDQNVRGRPIKLFVAHLFTDGANLEASSLVVIQNCTKDAGRVEMRVAIPID